MRFKNVSYCYTESELSTLLRLLDCDGIPFLPLPEPNMDATLDGLASEQILYRGENGAVVDRVTAFMLCALSACRAYVCICGEKSYLGLFSTPEVAFVLTCSDGRCILAPFESFSDAVRHAEKLLPRLLSPCELYFQNAVGARQRRFENAAELQEIFPALVTLTRTNEKPFGEI